MSIQSVDDLTLSLALEAAEARYRKDNSIDNFKIVAKYRFENNRRRSVANQSQKG